MASRQYRHRHQQARAQLKPLVDAGLALCAELVCVMPTRWIEPGTPWHLAHDRRTGDYLGPAHEKCNTAEAGRYVMSKRKRRREPPPPSRWVL